MANGVESNGFRVAIVKFILPGLLAIVAFFIIGFFSWNSEEHEKLRCDVKDLDAKKVSKERYVVDIQRVETKLDKLHDTLEAFILFERRVHDGTP